MYTEVERDFISYFLIVGCAVYVFSVHACASIAKMPCHAKPICALEKPRDVTAGLMKESSVAIEKRIDSGTIRDRMSYAPR